MKKELINGELLLKMSDSIIKSIKSSKEYRETVINVLDYMNNDTLNDLLVCMFGTVAYIIAL